MNALIQVARDASTYLAVELLLPGGSVIALLLWLFRHRFKKGAGPLGIEGSQTSRFSFVSRTSFMRAPHLMR
jgi:hypothetical protein